MSRWSMTILKKQQERKSYKVIKNFNFITKQEITHLSTQVRLNSPKIIHLQLTKILQKISK